GERFAFGHHYFRPHETHHSPSRRFYQNELFRMPLYEIIPLEAVVGMCCVLDLYTYCKGRPKGVKEQDVYICDYRLDKSAHLFYKIHRNRYPVCTKPYAFNHFPKRLTPKRDFSVRLGRVLLGSASFLKTVTECEHYFCSLQQAPRFPHYVPDNYKRNGGRSAWKSERSKEAAGCEDDASSCDRGEDFTHGAEDGRSVEDDVDTAREDPELLSKERARTGDKEEDEEEDEGLQAGVRKELGESTEDRIGEMLELPLSSASSPLPHPALSRREAQRERLDKILLDLLHRAPSKNGEGPGTKWGGSREAVSFAPPVFLEAKRFTSLNKSGSDRRKRREGAGFNCNALHSRCRLLLPCVRVCVCKIL
ncbi:hypothetical protein GOODEAATRI_022037, partial [Goodea atripinnis]